jgi:hypothetical protein
MRLDKLDLVRGFAVYFGVAVLVFGWAHLAWWLFECMVFRNWQYPTLS